MENHYNIFWTANALSEIGIKQLFSNSNTLYYHIRKGNIEILSFFSNRQSPQKRKF